MKRIRGKKLIIWFAAVASLLFVAISIWYLCGTNIQIMNPAGIVASRERQLIFFTLALSAVVVIPVFSLAIWIAWRYRDTNQHKAHKKRYQPNWSGSPLIEATWWAIPIILIGIVAVVAWRSSFSLDPYKPLSNQQKSITIQVVALDWKWLFIYPKQHLATVNEVRFPVNTQVNFELTADAPMNSFWIPQLGGQIYAMPGMTTHLYLRADKLGNYRGSSANISGQGFAGMQFVAKAVPVDDFNNWVFHTHMDQPKLTQATYNQLAKPSSNNPVAYYGNVDDGLYNGVIMKYMNMKPSPAPNSQPSSDTSSSPKTMHMEGM